MYWIIDESKSFIYQRVPPKSWKIAVVAGAILPYAGRKKWLLKHKSIGKGSDYTPHDEQEICEILSDMIDCGVQGVLVMGDVGYASMSQAEQLRFDLINPLYGFADKEPNPRGTVLRFHLDNLLGKGEFEFSLQEFYKVWSVLEVIVLLVKLFVRNLPKTRDIDLRKRMKLIIDDQCKASLITLRDFVHFFLWCRSSEGMFSCPAGSILRIKKHLRLEKDARFLNTNSLLNEILVAAHGAEMDDKYPELKIADLLSNFSRRALEGTLSFKVAQKLDKILKIKLPLQANPDRQALNVNVPPLAADAIKLLFG